MISNGYKVIGIEEDGNVKYDVMSSCPVSPSKPKFDGSTQKTISTEIQEAIKRFLSSNRTSFTVMQSTLTHALDADFMQILKNKRNEQMNAANDELMDLDTSTNCELVIDENDNDESILCENSIADSLKNCSVDDKDDKLNESTLNENDFLTLFAS